MNSEKDEVKITLVVTPEQKEMLSEIGEGSILEGGRRVIQAYKASERELKDLQFKAKSLYKENIDIRNELSKLKGERKVLPEEPVKVDEKAILSKIIDKCNPDLKDVLVHTINLFDTKEGRDEYIPLDEVDFGESGEAVNELIKEGWLEYQVIDDNSVMIDPLLTLQDAVEQKKKHPALKRK